MIHHMWKCSCQFFLHSICVFMCINAYLSWTINLFHAVASCGCHTPYWQQQPSQHSLLQVSDSHSTQHLPHFPWIHHLDVHKGSQLGGIDVLVGSFLKIPQIHWPHSICCWHLFSVNGRWNKEVHLELSCSIQTWNYFRAHSIAVDCHLQFNRWMLSPLHKSWLYVHYFNVFDNGKTRCQYHQL